MGSIIFFYLLYKCIVRIMIIVTSSMDETIIEFTLKIAPCVCYLADVGMERKL